MSRANKKRKFSASDQDLTLRPSKKRKKGSKTKESLLRLLRELADQDLEEQQKLYGYLQKSIIPLKCVNPQYESDLMLEYLPYFSPETLQRFYLALDQTNEKSSTNRMVAVAQINGSGRTELGIAAGLDPSTNYYTILVDFSTRSTILQWFKDKIEAHANENIKLRSKRAGMARISEWSTVLFQIWILTTIEWALDIADEFKDNKMQSRQACLSAMRIDSNYYDRDITEILDTRWRFFADLESIQAYYRTYFEEIQLLIGDSREILIYFDHVTLLKQEKIKTSFGDFDLYDLSSNFLRKLIQVPKWKICVADRSPEIFNIIEPQKIIQFSEISKVTYEDIKRTLESLFNITLADGGSDLKLALDKLCDKYECYISLLHCFLEKMNGFNYTAPELLKFVKKCAHDTFAQIRDRYKTSIKSIEKKPTESQKKIIQQLFAQIFITIAIQDQDYIEIEDESILAEFTGNELIMLPAKKGKHIIRRKDEPMFFAVFLEHMTRHVNDEAVIEYISVPQVDVYKHIINGEIISSSKPVILNMYDMKGRWTKYLLAWLMIRKSYQNLGKTTFSWMFMTARQNRFHPHNDDYESFSLDHVKKSSDLISFVTQQDSSTLLFTEDRPFNMFFMSMPHLYAKRAFGAVYCKQRDTNFLDVLRAVDPDYVLDKSEKELFREDRLESDPVMMCEIEAEKNKIDKSIEYLKINQRYWYRVIYSSELFPQKIVDDVNFYNKYFEVHRAPIILVFPNWRWIHEDLLEYFTKHEPCVFNY